MSLKYFIRRRAAKINHRKDIKIGDVTKLMDGRIHFLMEAPGMGISQFTIPGGKNKYVAQSIRRGECDDSLFL